MKSIKNINLSSTGVRCDGSAQCPEGEDEQDCDLGYVTIITFGDFPLAFLITELAPNVYFNLLVQFYQQ